MEGSRKRMSAWLAGYTPAKQVQQKLGAAGLLDVLQVPALCSMLAVLDDLRGVPQAARDIASLLTALCLRRSSGQCARHLVDDLWWHLAKSAGAQPFMLKAWLRTDPQHEGLLELWDARAMFALTHAEMEEIRWHSSKNQYVGSSEQLVPLYSLADVQHVAYRKWGTAQRLQAAVREWGTPNARAWHVKERRALLKARLKSEGLHTITMAMRLCQEFCNQGRLPLKPVIEALRERHQLAVAESELARRLQEEGLSLEYRRTELGMFHVNCPTVVTQDYMLTAVKQHERQRELQKRLADAGLPNTFLLQPLSQQHIREGAPAVEDLLQKLEKLPRPLGGSKPSHLCLAFGCEYKPGPRCSSNSCTDHCSDPLCPRHERANAYAVYSKLWRRRRIHPTSASYQQ